MPSPSSPGTVQPSLVPRPPPDWRLSGFFCRWVPSGSMCSATTSRYCFRSWPPVSWSLLGGTDASGPFGLDGAWASAPRTERLQGPALAPSSNTSPARATPTAITVTAATVPPVTSNRCSPSRRRPRARSSARGTSGVGILAPSSWSRWSMSFMVLSRGRGHRQRVAQARERVGGLALHRPGADPQVGRGLVDGQAPVVPQHHHAPLSGSQPPQGGPESIGVLECDHVLDRPVEPRTSTGRSRRQGRRVSSMCALTTIRRA